jgi:hypothetical protein
MDLLAFHYSGIEDCELLDVLSEIDALGDDALDDWDYWCTHIYIMYRNNEYVSLDTLVLDMSVNPLPQECFMNAMAPSTTLVSLVSNG